MTKDEIIAEMRQKPDAHLLLEWIYDWADSYDEPLIAEPIGAYFESIGQEH
jgi:hypothetical protein